MALPSWLSQFAPDILDANPDLAFFGAIPQKGNTAFQDYYRGQFGSIYDQYLGKRGRSLWGGSILESTFPDFLEDFPFLQNFQSLSPTARGESPARFAPRIRFA